MSLRSALLGLLAGGPMSGYDLARTFDSSLSGVWSARHSPRAPAGGRGPRALCRTGCYMPG